MQEPVWYEIGSHIGTVGRNMTPTNVSDGFHYVPFLQTLEVVLNNSSVFDQVCMVCMYEIKWLTLQS